jgi:uncharacterized protein
MADLTTETVATVATARAELSTTLKEFRASPVSAPVVLGSHRKPEAVLLPYASYLTLIAGTTGAPRDSVLDHLRACKDLVERIAELNKLSDVAVFGSVARGRESGDSDVDLLVNANDDATLFDFAQFAIDMEQLLGRQVDVVSRRALDPQRDKTILSEAVSL